MKKVKLFFVLIAVLGTANGSKGRRWLSRRGRYCKFVYLAWPVLWSGRGTTGYFTFGRQFSIGAWGSTSFESSWREFDLYAGYSIGNFSVLVTDYFFPRNLPDGEGSGYFDYSEHVFEATLGYSFGESFPLSLAWNTNFAGDDDYSSYFEASTPFRSGVSMWI
jgi:hypothetical protein